MSRRRKLERAAASQAKQPAKVEAVPAESRTKSDVERLAEELVQRINTLLRTVVFCPGESWRLEPSEGDLSLKVFCGPTAAIIDFRVQGGREDAVDEIRWCLFSAQGDKIACRTSDHGDPNCPGRLAVVELKEFQHGQRYTAGFSCTRPEGEDIHLDPGSEL